MALFRPRSKPSTDHEAFFLERYQRLLGLALQLTEGDRERAEDILHDAFIQFTFSRPDLNQIENLEAYLYGMLRKLHLSRMRRDSRSRIHPHFLVEYDSAETGLHMIDPRDRLQAQEELRRVCDYACARKETSKAGSVLILRFFHGYYPSEITKVMRSTRRAVDLRLRAARAEAKATLANPEALVFMNEKPGVDIKERILAQSTFEFLRELRRVIFHSRQGECLSPEHLDSIYEANSEAVDCRTLAHIVSCPQCLDRVNKINGLPLLSERYAVDTMGKDDSSRGGGPGEGTGRGADDKGVVRCRRRAREVFEHRPQELHISVNGFIQGSQTVNSEQSEQTLDIDMTEQIGFVEVFSEQETRLLFLDVEPPPSGAVEQRTRVELSNERSLELTLSFRGPWPTLHAIYHDPVFKAERESATELETESAAIEPKPQTNKAKTRKRSWRSRVTSALSKLERALGQGSFWLRPGVVTAIVAFVLTIAVLSLYLRVQPPVVTSADLLQRSTQAEEALALKPDTVLHRSIQLEERAASGDLIARNHIEVWQSAERGVIARRLYNEKNALVAGDWRRNDGVQTLYQHGVRPQLQLAPEKRPAAISFESVWRQSVSAQDFTSLVGGADRTQVEEGANTYVIRYARRAGQPSTTGLIRAALVLRRNDLHPMEQTLTVSNGKELRDYRLTETSFERRASSAVEPSVFEPEPELLSERMKDEGGRMKPEKSPSSPLPLTSLPLAASAEIEVEVLRLLHQANADLGEQVTVTRTQEGQLLVDALVDTDQRKAQILQALEPVRNNPAVRIKVSTIAEALSRQSKSKATPESVIIDRQDDSNRLQIADSDLRRYFSAKGFSSEQVDQEVRQLANRAVNQSANVMAHAWAIKRLGERFSAEQLRALTPEARAKWLAMVRTHAQSVREETAALRQELQPIFPSAASSTGEQQTEISSDADLLRAIERLFEVCSSNDRMVGSTFAIQASGPSVSDLQGPQFWRSLRRAEQLAAKISRQ